MKYLEKTFALPAANPKTSQKDWDRAFMTPDAFVAKYLVLDQCHYCGDLIWQTGDGAWSHFPREGDASPCYPALPSQEETK